MTNAAGRYRPELYQRSRPSYPDQVLEFALASVSGDTAPDIADIGCGTGLSTRPLHKIARSVVGVEPNAGMRAMAIEALADLGIPILAGSAEHTGLPDGAVDLVVAASCFEWFDRPVAAREFRRILRPRGQVLLMWNHRVIVDEVTAEWDRLWLRHMGPRVGHHPPEIDALLVPAFLQLPFRRFRRVAAHPYHRVRLLQFALSSGYAPQVTQPRRRRALGEAIEGFHDRHSVAGEVRLAFETVAFLGVPRDDLNERAPTRPDGNPGGRPAGHPVPFSTQGDDPAITGEPPEERVP